MINLSTVMEIYGNPDDLCFFIPKLEDGKFGFSLSRGPGHHFKPMLSSDKPIESRKKALGVVKVVLDFTMGKMFEERDEGCLTRAKVHKILKGLEENDQFDTFK